MRKCKWLWIFHFALYGLYAAPPEETNPPEIKEELISIDELQKFNADLISMRERLKEKFQAAQVLHNQNVKESAYRDLLEEIKALKKQISSAEEEFRKSYVKEATIGEEGYALWDQGETTLSQLVLEYGSNDFIYIIPQELSALKLHLHSSIAIPRESWSEMIELILKANGIGLKKLNPYAKQLYIFKHDPSSIEGIAHKVEDLQALDSSARVFFVFSTEAEQARAVQSFFERFSDPKETTIHTVGSKVLIVSSKESIEKLMSLYSAVWERTGGKVVRLVNLKKIHVSEAEKILKAFFPDPNNKARPTFYPQIADDLVIMALPQGLVLIGEGSAIERAEKMLADLENQLDDPSELVVFWYTCKHSDPVDLAEVLEKIYESLTHSDFAKKEKTDSFQPSVLGMEKNPALNFTPGMPVAPPFMQPGVIEAKKVSAQGNFIVDPKTGSLLMVVRKEELNKIKSLLKKLDVPKKMVQIDVLLVEKKLQDRKSSGINLLKIGTNASGKKETGIGFDTNLRAIHKGLLDFIISRPKGSVLPAIDLTFSFLMAQEDLRINANPSVLAINQTPATISIVEEISINNGAVQVDSHNGNSVEKSYTRAQYGTTLVMTPTIHLSDWDEDEEEQEGFITLNTNITFDTTETSPDGRPPVTRRHIENEVRVADGETIILGGLRRKSSEDKREKIPFLGDIPGIGKLFGTTSATDNNTEMFIFITPRIIRNPIEDLRRIRSTELQKRAGDIPEFLDCVEEARSLEKKKLFEDSIKMVFDKLQ